MMMIGVDECSDAFWLYSRWAGSEYVSVPNWIFIYSSFSDSILFDRYICHSCLKGICVYNIFLENGICSMYINATEYNFVYPPGPLVARFSAQQSD